MATSAHHAEQFDAVIIGAGFSGLYALYRLRSLGLRCRVYEAGDGVGGAWYWNRYPGARCDSESYFYCYSFSEELAAGVEMDRAVPRAGRDPAVPPPRRRPVRPVARHPTRHTGGRPRSTTTRRCRWTVATDVGDRVEARYVVSAIGWLSAANVPAIPGLDDFAGTLVPHRSLAARAASICHGPPGRRHRNRLDRDPTDPGRGRAGGRAHRLPADAELQHAGPQRAARSRLRRRGEGTYPELWRRSRTSPGACRCPRRPSLRRGRSRRGAPALRGGVGDRVACCAPAVQRPAHQSRARTSSRPTSSATRSGPRSSIRRPPRSWCPQGYPIAAKRPVLDTNYFETFNLPHVHLVDVAQTPDHPHHPDRHPGRRRRTTRST